MSSHDYKQLDVSIDWKLDGDAMRFPTAYDLLLLSPPELRLRSFLSDAPTTAAARVRIPG